MKKYPVNKKYFQVSLLIVLISVFIILVYSSMRSISDKAMVIIAKNKSCSPLYDIIKGNNTVEEKHCQTADAEIDRLMIEHIKLVPEQPTVIDNIKAEASTKYAGKGAVSLIYQWKINGEQLTETQGDTLPSGLFRNSDKISVVVTPYLDQIQGLPQESMVIVVHSIPPALELKEFRQKVNEAIELHLAGSTHEGGKLFYSLEEPFIEKMEIDKESGTILWNPLTKQDGLYQFGASVTDSEGNRTKKTFTVTLTTASK